MKPNTIIIPGLSALIRREIARARERERVWGKKGETTICCCR